MRKLFEMLSLPFVILNLFGVIVAGIWLAILGDWRSIGYGIAIMIVSTFLLSIVLWFAIIFIGPAIYFEK